MTDAPTVRCGTCRRELAEPPDTAPELREPCTTCGSTAREFGLSIAAEVKARASLRARATNARGFRFRDLLTRHKLSRSGREARETLEYDRSHPDKTTKYPPTILVRQPYWLGWAEIAIAAEQQSADARETWLAARSAGGEYIPALTRGARNP